MAPKWNTVEGPGGIRVPFFGASALSICRQKSHFKSVFEFWLGTGAERKRIRNCNESGLLVVVIEIYSSRLQILICSKKTSRLFRDASDAIARARSLTKSVAAVYRNPLPAFSLCFRST